MEFQGDPSFFPIYQGRDDLKAVLGREVGDGHVDILSSDLFIDDVDFLPLPDDPCRLSDLGGMDVNMSPGGIEGFQKDGPGGIQVRFIRFRAGSGRSRDDKDREGS